MAIRTVRILVSGFEAFGGETMNPTHRLVAELRTGGFTLPETCLVESVLLPVGFKTAFDVLENAIVDFQPDVVLSLGQAGGRSQIEIERVAINMMDAEIPDNDGFQPRDESIVLDGRAAHFSTLPLRKLLAGLADARIPAGISNSAGLFVCNYLFYKLQELAESSASSVTRSGFIHFPYLPEQTALRPGAPSMDLKVMKRALEIMIANV